MSKFTKARKDHICSLCFDVIESGDHYVYKTITIWEHPDNDTFGVYKAHINCDELWKDIGPDCDWNLPTDKWEWRDISE